MGGWIFWVVNCCKGVELYEKGWGKFWLFEYVVGICIKFVECFCVIVGIWECIGIVCFCGKFRIGIFLIFDCKLIFVICIVDSKGIDEIGGNCGGFVMWIGNFCWVDIIGVDIFCWIVGIGGFELGG